MYMSSWFCTAQIFMFVVIPTYTSSVSYAATLSRLRARAPRRKTILNRFLTSSVSLRYPEGKVVKNVSILLLLKMARHDEIHLPLPILDGGPHSCGWVVLLDYCFRRVFFFSNLPNAIFALPPQFLLSFALPYAIFTLPLSRFTLPYPFLVSFYTTYVSFYSTLNF